jgi:drug/metabolite transporter (DMT)-like permease
VRLTLLEPLVATLGACLALHEPLGVPSVVGGGLVLLGAAIAVTGGRTAGQSGDDDPDVRVGARLRIY